MPAKPISNPAEVDPISATVLVRRYLDAMEARNLAAASACLAPGFWMLFPGGVELRSLEALVQWAKPRYQSVRKTYERYDEVTSDTDNAKDANPAPDATDATGATCATGAERIVYCFGTLAGRWNDGGEFAGIRFIDRFTVKDGKLVDQRVWNDMGEARAAAPK